MITVQSYYLFTELLLKIHNRCWFIYYQVGEKKKFYILAFVPDILPETNTVGGGGGGGGFLLQSRVHDHDNMGNFVFVFKCTG